MPQIQAWQHIYANVEAELSPQGRGGYQTLFYSRKGLNEDEVAQIERRLLYYGGDEQPTKWVFHLLESGKAIAGQIVVGFFTKGFGQIRKVVSNPKDVVHAAKRAKGKTQNSIESTISHFNGLPKTSKYILLGLLVVAFVFVAGIMFINQQQANEAEQLAYDQQVDGVETKIENAEASIIYGDEGQ